jgi:hypothetical protein
MNFNLFIFKDIIFLRAWIDVPVPKFFVPMTDKLLASSDKWLGMRTVGRLRHELGGLKPEQKADSGFHRQLKHVSIREWDLFLLGSLYFFTYKIEGLP